MDAYEVCKKLNEQLNWQGPGGRQMAHIVLSREEAVYIHGLCNSQAAIEYDEARRILARNIADHPKPEGAGGDGFA